MNRCIYFIFFLKRFKKIDFRERGKKEERERERNID